MSNEIFPNKTTDEFVPYIRYMTPGEARRIAEGSPVKVNASNYIVTYQAQVMDGSTIQQNLSLIGVAEGTSPDSIIEAVFHRAATELAVKGLAVTSVIVLNLSRVW